MSQQRDAVAVIPSATVSFVVEGRRVELVPVYPANDDGREVVAFRMDCPGCGQERRIPAERVTHKIGRSSATLAGGGSQPSILGPILCPHGCGWAAVVQGGLGRSFEASSAEVGLR